MHESVAVRVATEDDLETVLDILADVAAEDQWIATEIPFDRDRRRLRLLQTLDNPDAQLFVATEDAELIGHLGVSVRRPGLLEFGMVVAPRSRGKGAGSALLTACIGWGRQIGAHKIMLEVFPHNTSAHALYSKLGFVEEGYFRRHLRRRNGELWDVIPMSLSLEDYH
jgi:putative acetyltransferase